jgi:hypothetical protein
MNWKFTAAAAGVTAVASWLGLATPPAPAGEAGGPERGANTSPLAGVSDISEEAVRLQARMREEKAYRRPSRNPFRFEGGRASAAPTDPRVTTPGPADAAPLVATPSIPEIKLAGVATHVVDGVSHRTAILSTANGVVLVREGEAVGALYRVAAVEEHAVALVTIDGTVRRLTLSR